MTPKEVDAMDLEYRKRLLKFREEATAENLRKLAAVFPISVDAEPILDDAKAVLLLMCNLMHVSWHKGADPVQWDKVVTRGREVILKIISYKTNTAIIKGVQTQPILETEKVKGSDKSISEEEKGALDYE